MIDTKRTLDHERWKRYNLYSFRIQHGSNPLRGRYNKHLMLYGDKAIGKFYKKWRELHIWDFLCGMYEGFAEFMAADVECHVRPPADDTDDESDEPSYQMGNSGARIITISTTTDNESDTEEEPPTQSPAENPKNPREGSEGAFNRKMKEIERERRGYYKSGKICPNAPTTNAMHTISPRGPYGNSGKHLPR